MHAVQPSMSSRLYLTSLTFVIIVFIVASDVTFRSFLSLHCHPGRRVIIVASVLHSTTFHRFCTSIGPRVVFDCRFLNAVGNTISVVCMSSLPPSCAFLHRCPNCFHHIVVCIIVVISYHALLRFVCIFHNNQSTDALASFDVHHNCFHCYLHYQFRSLLVLH